MSDEPGHVHDESCMSDDAVALIPIEVKLLPSLLGGLQLAIELSERSVLDGRLSVEDIIDQVTDIKQVLDSILHTIGADPDTFVLDVDG